MNSVPEKGNAKHERLNDRAKLLRDWLAALDDFRNC